MTLRGDRQWLFEQTSRLRRAQREAPTNTDLWAVRRALERQLGDGLSPALAASLLGVTRPALMRWVERGEIASVDDERGRLVLPLRAVLALHESLAAARESGAGHALEAVMARQRRAAEEIDIAPLLPSASPDDLHARASRRTLGYHCVLAARLDDGMRAEALYTLWSWRQSGSIHELWAQRWEDVLRRPASEIRGILVEDSPAAADLRQTSPLVVQLTVPERRRVLAEVR